MLDNPANQAIADNFEDGEEICCELPHEAHSGETILPQPEVVLQK